MKLLVDRRDLLEGCDGDMKKLQIILTDMIISQDKAKFVNAVFDAWLTKREKAFKDTSGYDDDCQDIKRMARIGFITKYLQELK